MKGATELKVGMFVFASLLIFMATVFLIGGERKFFAERYLLIAEFPDVQGLMEGAPVRVSGVDVGIVKKISFPEVMEERKIKVEMLIDKKVQKRIREDSYAMIQTMGLLGDKYVEISQGSPEKKIIPSGGIVQSIAPPDLYQVLQKGNVIIDNTIKITDSLQKILRSFGTEESAQDLAATIRSLDEILEEIKEGEGLLSFLIFDRRGKELIMNLSNSFEALGEILDRIKGGDGLLKKLIYDQQGGQLMEDIEIAARNIKEITAKLNEGTGTLGALLNDPSVFEDLMIVLGGAKRSERLQKIIQYAIKKRKEGY